MLVETLIRKDVFGSLYSSREADYGLMASLHACSLCRLNVVATMLSCLQVHAFVQLESVACNLLLCCLLPAQPQVHR